MRDHPMTERSLQNREAVYHLLARKPSMTQAAVASHLCISVLTVHRHAKAIKNGWHPDGLPRIAIQNNQGKSMTKLREDNLTAVYDYFSANPGARKIDAAKALGFSAPYINRCAAEIRSGWKPEGEPYVDPIELVGLGMAGGAALNRQRVKDYFAGNPDASYAQASRDLSLAAQAVRDHHIKVKAEGDDA